MTESRERVALRALLAACECVSFQGAGSFVGQANVVEAADAARALLAEPTPPEPREPEAESLMARVVAAYEDWDETPAFGEAIEVSRAIDAMRAYLKGQREARTGPPKEEAAAAPAETEPCGTYGCTRPKPKGAVFCAGCHRDYIEDPDAYK